MKNAATTSTNALTTASTEARDAAKPPVQAKATAPRKRSRPKPAPTVETVLEGLVLEATLFDKSASQANRIKAWELIGKHLGMFKDKKDESEPVSVLFDIKL